MRRPRRPSSPARSERSRVEKGYVAGGRSRTGTVTRRPSVVTTTATALRWRSPKKPKRPTPDVPPVAGARSLDGPDAVAQPTP